MTCKIERIGHLSPDGLEELVRLCENFARAAYGFFREEDFLAQRSQLRFAIAGIPSLFAAVDENTRAPVGVTAVLDGKIALLFVAPERRREGIGSMLLAKALSKKAFVVDVYRDNLPALAFYFARGFRTERRFVPDSPPFYPSLRLSFCGWA